ncbi:MAG: metal-dependent transcriptional regulator [Rothia sp. (in: high G+C Gram-positive bacteria)]|nr:metal-dependent transcriptional regulator [Rothia sp. (in: high G+C Gram-positive bacteria)]
MSLADLSDSTQNYLKIIWSITEHSHEPATTSEVAARAGLRQSTVSDAVKRLVSAGLALHQPYGGIELTEQGKSYALSMIRRHRLIETFLVQTLGYRWDQVHDEAEVLEHAVSDMMIDRIDALLGYPRRDPHGDPIPSPVGEVEQLLSLTLADCAQGQGAGAEVVVERIPDDDPALLRLLAESGVVPGAVLILAKNQQQEDMISFALGTGQVMVLSAEIAHVVMVSPRPSAHPES